MTARDLPIQHVASTASTICSRFSEDLTLPLSVGNITDEGDRDMEEVRQFLPSVSGTLHSVLVEVRQGDQQVGHVRWSYARDVEAPWLNATYEFVSQFQDVVAEFTHGVPVPKCVGHSHPMSLELLIQDSEIWWACPKQADLRERLRITPLRMNSDKTPKATRVAKAEASGDSLNGLMLATGML